MSSLRAILFVLTVSIVPIVSAAEPSESPLSQVKAEIDAGKAILVDVREQREWDAGHVDGAVFLPLRHIADGLSGEEAAKLPQDKTVYLHCAIGLRAASAGELLEKQGYTVRPLDVDWKALVKAGFPQAKN